MLPLVSSAFWCRGGVVCRVSLNKAHSAAAAAAAWRAGAAMAASWHFENVTLPSSFSTALFKSSVTALLTGFELCFPTLPVPSPPTASQVTSPI